MLNRFFRRSYFRVRNVTRKIAEQAQQIYWNDGVMPKDAIHVATALNEAVPVLETFDDALLKKTGRIGSPPLTIRKPIAPLQKDMFPR
jgi:predicted nucleic acid-binding protein